jgi:hypothetical protein
VSSKTIESKMADDKKRKYLLFSKDDGRPDALKPCAFFLSAAGCKNGSKCKFSHGEEKKGNNERPVPVAAPVVEAKKEKKQKREPVYESEEEYEAPAPVYVAPKIVAPKVVEKPVVKAPKPVKAPVVDTKEDEISLLKAQLFKQQQMFEEVMRKATQQQAAPQPVVVEKTPVKAAAASTKAKYAKKEVVAKVAAPKVAPSSYQQQNPNVQTYKAPVAAPPGFNVQSARGTANPEISDYSGDSDNDNDDEDDTEFLFDAVNVALKGGRKASPVPAPAPVQVYQMPALVAVKVAAPVSAGNDNSLFLTAEKTVKSLQSSGTKHATHGNVKKNLFANQKTPGSTPSAAPKTPSSAIIRSEVFDASKVDFPRLPWTSLVHSTQAHQRYKKEYTFEVDHSWIKARPVGEW